MFVAILLLSRISARAAVSMPQSYNSENFQFRSTQHTFEVIRCVAASERVKESYKQLHVELRRFFVCIEMQQT